MRLYSILCGILWNGVSYVKAPPPICDVYRWNDLVTDALTSVDQVVSDSLYYGRDQVGAVGYVSLGLGKGYENPDLYRCILCIEELLTAFFTTFNQSRAQCIAGKPDCMETLQGLSQNFTACSSQTLNLKFPDVTTMDKIGQGCTADPDLNSFAAVDSFVQGLVVCAHNDTQVPFDSCSTNLPSASGDCRAVMQDVYAALAEAPSLSSCFMDSTLVPLSLECVKNVLPVFNFFRAASGVDYVFAAYTGDYSVYQTCNSTSISELNSSVALYPGIIAVGVDGSPLSDLEDFANLVIDKYSRSSQGGPLSPGLITDLPCSGCISDLISNIKSFNFWTSCSVPSGDAACGFSDGAVFGRTESFPYCGSCLSIVEPLLAKFAFCSGQILDTTYTEISNPFNPLSYMCSPDVLSPQGFSSADVDPVLLLNLALPCALAEPSGKIVRNCAAWEDTANTMGNTSWVYSVFYFPRGSNREVRTCFDCLDRFILAISSDAENISQSCWNGTAWDAYSNVNSSSCLSQLALPILEFESCTGYITFPNSTETACSQEEWDSLNVVGETSMSSLISSALYQTMNAPSAFEFVLSNLSRPIPPTIMDYHCLVCVQQLFTDFFNASAYNRILCINGEGSSCVDKLAQLEENYLSCANQTLSLTFPDALSTQLGDGCSTLGSATYELLTQVTLISYLYSMYYPVISFTDFINVLVSTNSTFNDSSYSCKQASFDLHQEFAYGFFFFCEGQVSSWECLEKLLQRPLQVFSAATGVGFMFSLPEGQVYRPCPASEWNSFTANVTTYPALVAAGIRNDSLAFAAGFALEHYDVPPVGDVDVFAEMEHLTCNQCLGNFINNVRELDLRSPSSPCLTPSVGPYCDINSGVVYDDSLVIFPYCGACISAISTPLFFFDLCSNYDLSTVFTPPEPKFSLPTNQCTGGEAELGEFPNTLTELDPFKFVNRALSCAYNDQLVSSECLLENFYAPNISTLECVSCIDRLLGDLNAIGNETLQGNCSLANVWDVSLHNCSSLVEINSVLNTFDSCNGLVRTNIEEILTCNSPLTPEMMPVIGAAVSSAMYQANSSAAAFQYVEQALLVSGPGFAVPDFPCLRCLSAFFTAFFSLQGRDACIVDSSPGSACSEAISAATGALNDCSGQNVEPFTFPNLLTTQLGDGCTALPSPANPYIDDRINSLISCFLGNVYYSNSQPKIPFDQCYSSAGPEVASPSCYQAFNDFYTILMNADPVGDCSGTSSQLECIGILVNKPLMVFSRATGVGYMFALPEGQTYSPCTVSDFVNIQSNVGIYPALLAAGIAKDSLSDAMKFAQKYYGYSIPTGASAFDQVANLPCNQCFDNLLQNIGMSHMPGCTTSSNQSRCDAASAVVYGNVTVYPFCRECLNEMSYPQLFFLFCAGANFSTNPVVPTRSFPPPSSCSRNDWSAILDDSNFTDAVVYALYEAAKGDFDMSTFLNEFSVRMNNNSCMSCVIGSLTNFTQSDGKMSCIANPASPGCITALAGMTANLSDCSGQDVPPLNFPQLCQESEFPAISSVIGEFRDLLYQKKNFADALPGAQAIVGSPNTCMDCMELFLSAFYKSDGRNQCISRHDGQACKDAISGATSAFNNCSGQRLSLSFPTTACSDDQMNRLLDSGFVSDLAVSFTATDPAIALEVFKTTLALDLPEGLTFPCINYCLEDLITSTINLGVDALFICASDIFSPDCLNTIKEPVDVYSACSNQNLTAVLAASAPSTSGSSVSLGQVSLSLILTSLAILVAFA